MSCVLILLAAGAVPAVSARAQAAADRRSAIFFFEGQQLHSWARVDAWQGAGDTPVDEGRQSPVFERRNERSNAAYRATLAPAPPAQELPAAVTNNAVAAGVIGGRRWIFSALGIDASKKWSGITRRAFAWSEDGGGWRELPPVPGPVGRLAATAQVVRGRLFVFGGYTVDGAGRERSVGAVDIFDPATDRWSSGAPIPVPVDDAVSGVLHDSLAYLVSGWHDTGNVRHVQIYDAARDRWTQGTPIPGPGVFGHTGAMAGATIVFVDGAVRQPGDVRYGLVRQTWVGTVHPARPALIEWKPGPVREGPILYRAAAASCGPLVILAGGTANPYNYDGIGYDRRPSEPLAGVWAFDARSASWRRLPDAPAATMDHRALAITGDTAWIVGGMRAGQRVSAAVEQFPLAACAG